MIALSIVSLSAGVAGASASGLGPSVHLVHHRISPLATHDQGTGPNGLTLFILFTFHLPFVFAQVAQFQLLPPIDMVPTPPAGTGMGTGTSGTSSPGSASETVTTKLTLVQQDVSSGSLGGETKQFQVTLTPSGPQATYATGSLTIGCGTDSASGVSFNYDDVSVPVASSVPGAFTLGPIRWSVAHDPSVPATCGDQKSGYRIFVRYSGGSVNKGGTTYIFSSDSWGPLSVVPESNECPGAGCSTVSQP